MEYFFFLAADDSGPGRGPGVSVWGMESYIRVNGVGMHDVLTCCSFKVSRVEALF